MSYAAVGAAFGAVPFQWHEAWFRPRGRLRWNWLGWMWGDIVRISATDCSTLRIFPTADPGAGGSCGSEPYENVFPRTVRAMGPSRWHVTWVRPQIWSGALANRMPHEFQGYLWTDAFGAREFARLINEADPGAQAMAV